MKTAAQKKAEKAAALKTLNTAKTEAEVTAAAAKLDVITEQENPAYAGLLVDPAAAPAPEAAPASEPEAAAPALVDPVVCVICKRTVEKASTLSIARNGYNDYFCKGESSKSGCKAPKPSAAELAEKAAAAKTAAEARKAEKAAKSAAKAAPKTAGEIYYTAPELAADSAAAAAFGKAARQLKIIVNLIAGAPARTMTKKAVCETLDALNGRGDAATDLATRQTALAILMHYQKVMTDNGFLVQFTAPSTLVLDPETAFDAAVAEAAEKAAAKTAA